MKSRKYTPPKFDGGDRVAFIDPKDDTRGFFHHGVVVSYKKSPNLDAKNPRVRWASGFGISVIADSLRHLTEWEKESLPMPKLFDSDYPALDSKYGS